MDDEVDLSSHLVPNPDMPGEIDDLLRSIRTCTHTHTCNPPGPDATGHTHTCYHTHTRVIATGERGEEEEPKKPRKPLGNREAVRKYREKKKAHAAYLEEEVKKLRLLNQQLIRRLQGQAALEAEVFRLRALLVDLRGKIDTELGVFPFQKHCTNSGFQCDTNTTCIDGAVGIAGWEGSCQPVIIDCQSDLNGYIGQSLDVEVVSPLDLVGSLVSSTSQVE
uniref:Transcription factor TGA3 n=1 Tax=Anthurium amnicola TaxID=1678845 RepID=A0A1D1ZHT0_9ARAE